MGRPKKLREGDAVLTHEHIVATAMRLADADGIEQLSMRRLATELDCGVMSRYHYIADKEALVEALVDEVAGQVVPPPTGVAWRTAVRHIAESTLEAQLRHPWAIPVWSTSWPGPYRFGLVEQLLDALADAELPPDIADLGFHAVTNHVQGFAQQRISFGQLESRAEVTRERLEAILAQGEFPRVAEHVEFHRSDRIAHDEFGQWDVGTSPLHITSRTGHDRPGPPSSASRVDSRRSRRSPISASDASIRANGFGS